MRDPNNLRSLCRGCHFALHRQESRRSRAAEWTRVALAAWAALLAGCAEAPTEPPDLTKEPLPAPPPAFEWLQGQWYSDDFDKPFSEEVVSCTGRFVGTLSCNGGDYGWRGPAYMQVRQDTITGLIEGAFEYIGRDYYEADVAGDLGITDTVTVTITISGPYVSGLLTFQGTQPRGVPEDGFPVVMPEYDMGCHQTTVSRSETIQLVPKEGVWVSSRITCEEQFADSTGSYHIRVAYGGEGLFRPAREAFWPGYYAGEWSLGGRHGLATVTLSHVAHWFRIRPEGAILTVTFHGWDPCEAGKPFQVSGGGGTLWRRDGDAEFGFDSSLWRGGKCPGDEFDPPQNHGDPPPARCAFPFDHPDFSMLLRTDTRLANMSLTLDCGAWGVVNVKLEDAPMTAPSPWLVEWRLARGTG